LPVYAARGCRPLQPDLHDDRFGGIATERLRGNRLRGKRQRRECAPAIEAAAVRRPARIYDLRSTFASNALAAGVSVFELARIMGTSAHMIERSYGVLIEGAGAGIASRLDGFDAAQAEESEAGSGV
jgi:hypothetical protein